uniref:Uncharacterized protein n=1 Tax=viral metagenome TaxID=1070528 RepID=A0A6C0IJW7_9ZZZZ
MLDKKYTQWFPQLTIDILEQYGECKIVKLFVGKHDLHQKFFRYTVMNILSDGKWSKELIKRNKNKIMHTYIVCTVIYEESEIDIMISKELYLTCNKYDDAIKKYPVKRELYALESFDENINITMNSLLEQTIKNIGDEHYFIWAPWSSCQDFAKDILVTVDAYNYKRLLLNKSANNIRLYDDKTQKFIIQNLNNVIDEMPSPVHIFFNSYTAVMKKLYNISL